VKLEVRRPGEDAQAGEEELDDDARDEEPGEPLKGDPRDARG